MKNVPTEETAIAIIQAVFNQSTLQAHRFETGLCHYVYDVIMASQQRVVVRIAHPYTTALLEGGLLLSEPLRSQGVPLPKVLHADLSSTTVPFAFVILEHLPGTDLGNVYAELTKGEKHAIAYAVNRVQSYVHLLPCGKGFGCTTSLEESPPYPSWIALVEGTLSDSEETMSGQILSDDSYSRSIERLRREMSHMSSYLAEVEPIPFMDDITTKNVLVHRRKFSGIVDVDEICYGDPLWTIGITQMALLKQRQNLDYTNAWIGCLNLSATQKRALTLYTAMFCVIFLSELGQTFNKPKAVAADTMEIQYLLNSLNELL